MSSRMIKFNQYFLGFGAFWYFATYVSQAGTLNVLPLFLAVIVSAAALLVKDIRNELGPINKYDLAWAASLALYGGYYIFIAWRYDEELPKYDNPSKFVAGALIALVVLRYRINLNWIKAGCIVSVLILINEVIDHKNIFSRFSINGSTIKFGNAIAYQAILLFGLSIIEKNKSIKTLLLAGGLVGIFFLLKSGTRGAFIPVILSPIFYATLYFVYTKKISLKGALLGGTTAIVIVVSALNMDFSDKRINQAKRDFQAAAADKYTTSVGYRLMMQRAGLSASLSKPFLGHGFDTKPAFTDYAQTAPTKGLRRAAAIWSKRPSFFHNTFVDQLYIGGFTALALLGIMLWSAMKGINSKDLIYVGTPVVGLTLAGLSDSTFALSITVTYFVLAITLLRATTKRDNASKLVK